MNRPYIVVGMVAAAVLVSSSAASAQVTSVTVSTNASTTSPAAGTSAATLGTVTLTTSQSGQSAFVSSLPVIFSSSGGASVSHLSNCHLEDQGGQRLTTMINPSAGSNILAFSSPIAISGSSLQTLLLKCDVSNDAPSGSTFTFSVATPTTTADVTATTPTLAVNLNATPSVRPGSQDIFLALITLSARTSSNAIQISQLPLDVAFSNGATEGSISDCRVRNLANVTVPLNTMNVGIVQGSNTIPFDAPLVVPAGTTVSLAFTCDVAQTAPLGGIVGMSLPTNRMEAIGVNASLPVTITTGLSSSSQAGPISGAVTFSQTTTTLSATRVPGVPNTGSSSNIMLLGMTGLLAALSLFFARRMAR